MKYQLLKHEIPDGLYDSFLSIFGFTEFNLFSHSFSKRDIANTQALENFKKIKCKIRSLYLPCKCDFIESQKYISVLRHFLKTKNLVLKSKARYDRTDRFSQLSKVTHYTIIKDMTEDKNDYCKKKFTIHQKTIIYF